MIPNYPRGIVAVPWRREGVLNWNVYYTQPDTIGAEERKIWEDHQGSGQLLCDPRL